MPTSADYLGWATSLEGLADDLADDDQRLLTAWDAGPVVGGELAVLTHRAVEAAGDNVAAVRTELYRLRAECEDRAQVCADYATALGRYSAAYDRYLIDVRGLADGGDGTVPIPPERPSRPAPWAEA